MDNKFDIYCVTKFSLSESRFSRICAVDPVVRLIGDQHAINDDGYLGISISQFESLWLVKVLRRMGIQAYPVPERYKTSMISSSDAMQMAQGFITEKRTQRPDYEYGDVEEIPVSWWLSKIAYGYFSQSKKMMRDGISPAGITVCIDRSSGIVLQERELVNAELPIMLTE